MALKTKKKSLSVLVDAELLSAFKKVAIDKDKNVSEMIRDFMKETVENEAKK